MDTQTETCQDEIDLLYCAAVIMRHKVLIFCITILGVIVTGVAALLMTPVYEANALIAPAGKSSTDYAGMGGMSAMAFSIGLTTPASASMAELVNLLNSNILKEETVRRHNLVPLLSGKSATDTRSEEQKIRSAVGFLQGALKVEPMRKENAIRLSMRSRDPKMAATILDNVLAELTEHMSSEARRVAQTNKKYLEGEVDRTTDPFIRAKIYSLIAQQVETSMMAEVKENFAFKMLDPPRVPSHKSGPNRSRMVMIAFAASLIAGIVVAFLREYWSSRSEDIKKVMRRTT